MSNRLTFSPRAHGSFSARNGAFPTFINVTLYNGRFHSVVVAKTNERGDTQEY